MRHDLSRLAANVRSLPIALAHSLARTKPDDERMDVLNRVFKGCKPIDQLRCRDELLQCRMEQERGRIRERAARLAAIA